MIVDDIGAGFTLGAKRIGRNAHPFIIAEMSGNHNQSLPRALEIVDAAARSGAHAVKLQTYTADTITIDVNRGEFVISEDESLWKGNTLYELYRQAYTPWEWHAAIMDRARSLGLVCFSTPFDETAVDFLETLGVPAYKIASFEIVHLPLIRRVAATGKPIIMSVGMASLAEIDEAARTARESGCRDLVLLKCTSTYPASPQNSNVATLPVLRELFDCEVGLSDHTMGIGAALAAVAHGATVVEKHFTLSRADGGVDSSFSMEPDELAQLVEETERAWLALGKVSFGPTEAERSSVQYRRSVYVVEDVKVGEVFTSRNVRVIRPGLGLEPKNLEHVLGRSATRDLRKGTPMDWRYLG